MGVSIEIFKVHTFFNMSTTSQAFFFYITLKRTLFHEEWYQFHFSTMICVGITTSVAFFLSTTVHNFLFQTNSVIYHKFDDSLKSFLDFKLYFVIVRRGQVNFTAFLQTILIFKFLFHY